MRATSSASLGGRYGGALLLGVLVAVVVVLGSRFASPALVPGSGVAIPLLWGTVAISLAALWTLSIHYSPRAAVQFLALAFLISWVAEASGVRFGWPFGERYSYDPHLVPLLPGGVPLFIPLAWFVLAAGAVVLFRFVPTHRPDGSVHPPGFALRTTLCALSVVACDLVLDPVAVAAGVWSWDNPGGYFGIPYANFAGWALLAGAISAAGFLLTDIGRARPREVPLPYDVAWLMTNLVLLALLVAVVDRQLDTRMPLLLALLFQGPFLLLWTAKLVERIAATRPRPRIP